LKLLGKLTAIYFNYIYGWIATLIHKLKLGQTQNLGANNKAAAAKGLFSSNTASPIGGTSKGMRVIKTISSVSLGLFRHGRHSVKTLSIFF
jgi:hypothetical protein